MKRRDEPYARRFVIAVSCVLSAACHAASTPGEPTMLDSNGPMAAMMTHSATANSQAPVSGVEGTASAGASAPAPAGIADAGSEAKPSPPSAAREDQSTAAWTSAPAAIDAPPPVAGQDAQRPTNGPNMNDAMSGEAAPDCLDCGDYTCYGTPLRFLAHGEATPDDQTPFDATDVGSAGAPDLYQCFFFAAQ